MNQEQEEEKTVMKWKSIKLLLYCSSFIIMSFYY